MTLVSLEFLLFVCIAMVGYYLVPKQYQWIWLLVFSYIYYISSGFKIVFFLVFATSITYAAGRILEKIDSSDIERKQKKKKKRHTIIIAMILDFGILAVLKYTNFTFGMIGSLLHVDFPTFQFLLPLGISFYTFQSVGYILDVYWGKCSAEKNIFKFALFVSFFPQIMQGPIGRFGRLAEQLYAPHSFEAKKVERAFWRILVGFFKKIILADNAVIFVDAIFGDHQTFSGLAIVGALAYSVQLYGDFSGGIDIVTGVAGLLGIELDENFKRPFFARSITDFWHRWHITLGTWMKDYVFYPLSLSKGMGKFGKFCKKHLGKQIGRALPICVANIVVFLIVGIWHGAAWKFIVYGLYNGVIIGISGLLIPNYRKWKSALHINDKARYWTVFQIIRTFLLVNISWFFDRADTVPQALQMMKNAVTQFNLAQLLSPEMIAQGNGTAQYLLLSLGVVLVGGVILFIYSLIEENGVNIGDKLMTCPVWIRSAVYLIVIFSLPAFGALPGMAGGFIYAQF